MLPQAQAKGLRSVADVREAGRQLAGFSPAMAAQERRLKTFMYERLYYHPEQLETARVAHQVIAQLFAAFDQDPALMNSGWQDTLPDDATGRSRHIADFIAGMTDRYAIDCYARIFGQVPAGLSNV